MADVWQFAYPSLIFSEKETSVDKVVTGSGSAISQTAVVIVLVLKGGGGSVYFFFFLN